MVGDLAKMEIPEDCVNFVITNHLLEHLPDLDTAKRVVEKAIHAAREFVFIKGPYFDADIYLVNGGLEVKRVANKCLFTKVARKTFVIDVMSRIMQVESKPC